ncbi:MAG: hypothetical protein LLG37_06540 [Spirochaetia bacterium]|nr:hypothetical protein [Spirochaetia bacterium]
MLLDLKPGHYTIIPLAGSMAHGIKITGRANITIDARPGEADVSVMFPADHAVNKLKNLKWKNTGSIDMAIELFEEGYWGHVIGYKRKGLNLWLEKGYVPWFYRGVKDEEWFVNPKAIVSKRYLAKKMSVREQPEKSKVLKKQQQQCPYRAAVCCRSRAKPRRARACVRGGQAPSLRVLSGEKADSGPGAKTRAGGLAYLTICFALTRPRENV